MQHLFVMHFHLKILILEENTTSMGSKGPARPIGPLGQVGPLGPCIISNMVLRPKALGHLWPWAYRAVGPVNCSYITHLYRCSNMDLGHRP